MRRGIFLTMEAAIAVLSIWAVLYSNAPAIPNNEPVRLLLAAQDAALVLGEEYGDVPPTRLSLQRDLAEFEKAFPAYCFQIDSRDANAGSCNVGAHARASIMLVLPEGIYPIGVTVHSR